MRPHRRAIVVAAVTALSLVSGCTSPSPTTIYTDAAGRSVTVDWADFPAYSGTDTELVLSGASVEKTEARAEDLFTAIKTELDRQFSTTGWSVRGEDGWSPTGGNGYGGRSMLVNYNSATWESGTAIPPDQWPEVISTVERVADERGFAGPSTNDAGDFPEWMQVGSFFRGAEWFEVSVRDASLNEAAQKEEERLGWLVHGVQLFYGTNALPEKDRAEFAERAAPFLGLEHPEPTASD